MSNNPLLTPFLPVYKDIKPEHVEPAITELLRDSLAALEKVTHKDFPANYDKLEIEFDEVTSRLGKAWGIVGHMMSVQDTPELREVYNKVQPLMVDFSLRIGSDKALYKKYKKIDHPLNAEQSMALADAIRGFEHGGIALKTKERNVYGKMVLRLSELSQQFSENVLDSTDAFKYYVSDDLLDGVPQDVKDSLRNESGDGYTLTLQMPCYLPIMQYATNRAVRELMYKGYVTRCGGADPTFDNTENITEILKLRDKTAKILGFSTYADLSLADKMAKSPQDVIDFLRDIGTKAKPFAKAELEELRNYAALEYYITYMEPWDMAFIAQAYQQKLYAYSDHEVKQYFQRKNVLNGLFKLVEEQFGVTFMKAHAEVWHKDVEFYHVIEGTTLKAMFYLDTFARSGKRSGAWMDSARDRWKHASNQYTDKPATYIICNFTPSDDIDKALMTHDDVITLFHEMGHALQHMLTTVDDHGVSGINGVEWDGVELASQFMENFCWEWEVVESMSAHIDTGKKMPKELFDKLYGAKNYLIGMGIVRQIEMSMIDMVIHGGPVADFTEVIKDVRNEFAVVFPPEYAKSLQVFTHIFGGGYAAGYYSYKWAEVMSADAYQIIKDSDDSQEALARYKKHILEPGGSKSILDSFIEFAGRAPTTDAHFKHVGLK